MRGNSTERRSSTNPVRVSTLDKEDNSRKSQISKSKISISSGDNSHIPRPRFRASSCDRSCSNRASSLKATSKTPLRHGSTTPKTPLSNAIKNSTYFTIGNSNIIHGALPTGRRSLSADRASSLGVKGPRKDTRLLTDKVYQAEMLSKIDNYFIENHCSSMLNSNGSLKPITLKMFVEVSAYLVKMLDIKQILTSYNYVEELPKIAKKLHYPGTINKSWLKTANAMHSWSNVLGWISWLVQLCKIKEIALQTYNLENLPFMGNDEKEAEINKKSFFSMIDFYNAWNDEKLDEEAQLVEKYLQEIEEHQGINKEDLNNAHAELEKEIIKLQAIEKNASNIDEEVKHLEEVLSSLKKDEEKQLSDIAAKEKYIKTINSETDLIHADCKMMCEQIRLQNIQHDELVSVIKQQPMSKVERDKILEKCTEIQNYMHQFNEHLQDIQKDLYTMDIKLATINNNLTKTILTYNKELFMYLGDVGVDLEELKMPEKGILQPNIMEELNVKANLMNDLKELLKAQIVEKERSLEINSNELENLQERLKILEDESNDIANKIKEKKDLMNKIKTNAKSEEAKLKEQIKNLQNDIKEIKDSMPNTERLAEEIKETTDKLDAVQRRKTYIEESAKLFFDKFYEILGEHRNELHSILTRHSK